MTKKKAILIVLGVEVLVYLFLLVGLPTFKDMMFGPDYMERTIFAIPMFVYFVPLIIGLFMIMIIWRHKEVKEE